ncbi:hypothetical protein [Mucilaginibacter myungsuensis]|uniref:DUF2975 domain-containing protein n=1 Tax=Mucilaginibacter myungsuensis TaxID=649104 RepID=A0A929PW95_9SPHI|nr:hypothetical protein [Mucilaginibacter myungsuensis]MBE9661851.1 hypothetical protein [Mucilaginibacter myungsuensis]MDN3599715.1 hypothetical protein [Mucilaginibacter myungsuensis]
MDPYTFTAWRQRSFIILAIFLFIACVTPIVSAAFIAGEQMAIPVHGINNNFIDRKEWAVPGGDQYFTGFDGELWHRPKNFGEVMLLQTYSNPGIDVLTSLQLIMVIGMTYWIFRKQTTGLVLNKSMLAGLFFLGTGLIFTNMIIDFSRSLIATHYVPYITNGHFKGIYKGSNVSTGMFMFIIMLLLLEIPKRGLELQKEADLTI